MVMFIGYLKDLSKVVLNDESKVIIEKSRGEVSLMVPDTIENASKPIKN